MKPSSFFVFLFSTLAPIVSCDDHPVNPWETCPPSSYLKCSRGTNLEDETGPTLENAMMLRDHWVDRANDLTEGADTSTQDPDPWGGHRNEMLQAAVYGDACRGYSEGSGDNDVTIKVCQQHKSGNPAKAHYVKNVCVSHYMDDIINGCKGKAEDPDRLWGQVWVERWGITLRITTKG